MNPTARQITAGRALLGWTMEDLAAAADVGRSTVADYERGVRDPTEPTMEKMTDAMKRAGLRFIPHGVQIEPAARVAAAVGMIIEKHQNGSTR